MLEYVTALSGLSVITLSLMAIYGIKAWLTRPANLPPMPCSPLPLVGHALFMKPTMIQALVRWRKELGDIFTIYLHRKPVIVLGSQERLNEAFVKKADFFSNRPAGVRQAISGQDGTHGIVGSSKDAWKEQRSLALSILRSFGMGKNIMARRISEEVEMYLNALSDLKGQAKEVNLLTNIAVSNVICAVLLGKRFDYDDSFFVKFIQLSNDIMKLVPPDSILNTFSWLRFLPGDLFGADRLRRAFADLRDHFSDRFIAKSKVHLGAFDSENFISVFLKEMKKRGDLRENTAINDTNLRWVIVDLFVAGTETTSTTILWAMNFAARYPEYQEKIYREIEEAVGTDRVPGTQDRPKMNLLNAYIMETQRLGSIAPLSVPHICSQTTELGGYTIPEGCTVIPYLDGILKDASVWSDPEQFKPERFLDEDNKLLTHSSFLPFSIGRRICLGESLARMELFLFLSALFQRFQVLPETPDSLPPLEGIFGVTMAPKPAPFRFKQRY